MVWRGDRFPAIYAFSDLAASAMSYRNIGDSELHINKNLLAVLYRIRTV